MSFEKIYKNFETEAKFWFSELEKYNDNPFHEDSFDNNWTLSKLYFEITYLCEAFYINSIEEGIKSNNTKGKLNFRGLLFQINKDIAEKDIKQIRKEYNKKSDIIKVADAKGKLIICMKKMHQLLGKIENVDPKIKINHPIYGYMNLKTWYKLPEIHFKKADKLKVKLENYIVSKTGTKSNQN